MSLSPCVPERDHDAHLISYLGEDNSMSPQTSWRGARTGRPHLNMDAAFVPLDQSNVKEQKKKSNDMIDSFLSERALSSHDKNGVLGLVRGLKGRKLTGEILFLLRPWLYVLIIHKYGRKSWISWLSSLFLELSSIILLRDFTFLIHLDQSDESKTPSAPKQLFYNLLHRKWPTLSFTFDSTKWTSLEYDELKRRIWLLLYYLLRNPFYAKYTKYYFIALE